MTCKSNANHTISIFRKTAYFQFQTISVSFSRKNTGLRPLNANDIKTFLNDKINKLASLRSQGWGYPTSHEEDQNKKQKKKTKKKNEKRNWCVRPGVSCPVPVFSRHDRRANSTLSALQLEVRKIPFPICFRFRRGSFLLFLFNFLY